MINIEQNFLKYNTVYAGLAGLLSIQLYFFYIIFIHIIIDNNHNNYISCIIINHNNLHNSVFDKRIYIEFHY